MKVVVVSPFAQRAGSERYLGLVLDGIPREYVHEVVFLQDGPFAEDVRGRGFPVTVWPTGAGPAAVLRAAWRLRRRLARQRPDLVHANGIKAALVSVLATLGTRTPVVWVKHDLSFDRSLARPVAVGCRLVVGVSVGRRGSVQMSLTCSSWPNHHPPAWTGTSTSPTSGPTIRYSARSRGSCSASSPRE
jgi:hypothetical protein